MDRIGVRELRQNASRYLARVAATGEIDIRDLTPIEADEVGFSGSETLAALRDRER